MVEAAGMLEYESETSIVLTDRWAPPCCLLKLSRYLRSASLIRSDLVRCSHWAIKSTCSSIAGGSAMSTFLGMFDSSWRFFGCMGMGDFISSRT